MAGPAFLRRFVPGVRTIAVSALGAVLVIVTAVPGAALAPAATSPHPAVAVSQPSMTFPTDSQTGVDTTQPFTWSTVPQAQGYILVVGTAVYGTNLVNSGILPPTRSSFAVPALPAGPTLHATLLTEVNGGWTVFQAINFTAAPGQGSFTYPLTAETGVEPTGPFTWSTIPQSQGYILAVGTTKFGTNLVNSGVLPATQSSYAAAGSLPAGQTLYATLLTKVNGAFTRFQAITFTAGLATDRFTYPVAGQTNVDATKAFAWSSVAASEGAILVVGTKKFGTDLVNSGVLLPTQTSYLASTLPAGKTLYGTLLTKTNGSFTRFQAISFTTASAFAHGALDASFGTGGDVTVASANSGVGSLAFIASTGQTMVGVLVWDGSGTPKPFIVRLSSGGAIDATYGSGGRANLPSGMAVSQVLDAGDGKVLAVGTPAGTGGPTQAVGTELVRLTPTGALDPTFGTGGVVSMATLGSGLAKSAVMASDGRIFVGTDPATGLSTSELGIAAFTTTGTLDISFGTSGIASTVLGGSVNGRVGLAVQPDGKLVIAGGVAISGSPSQAVVGRFLATGKPDNGFGTNGVFAKLFGGTGDSVGKIAVASSGDLVVAGIQFTPTDSVGLLAEITSAGFLNTSFGSGGVILENPTLNGFDLFVALAISANNEVYGLLMEGDGPNNGSLRRYTADGKPDAAFGSVGVVSLSGVIPSDLVIAYQGRPEVGFEIPPISAAVVAERFLP